MIHLLLLEDDSTLGETMRDRLEKEGYRVTLARDVKTAKEEFEKNDFNLLVVDVGLPDGSGFEFAKSVRRKKAVPFIFVTAQSGAEDRLKGYEIGAEEFIPKPFHLREFLLRVKHVLDNHARHEPDSVGDLVIDWTGMTVTSHGQVEAVSPRELKVLKILVERAPRVISRDELLDGAWGKDEFPSNRTVDNIIVRLRAVLGKESKRIQSVRGIGYKWLGGPNGE